MHQANFVLGVDRGPWERAVLWPAQADFMGLII